MSGSEQGRQQWLFRRGELARDGWETVVDHHTPGWQHTGLRVSNLAAGATAKLEASGTERLIVPLSGAFEVTVSERGERRIVKLNGRQSVFHGPSDVLYLSSAAAATIRSTDGGRIAVASSPTTELTTSRYLPVDEVPVELRGAGISSRQVHNFGTPEALDAARFIVCEVITPANNWSSYPPHKHDTSVPGHESRLEEIYYFEVAPSEASAGSTSGDHAFGSFHAYSSDAGSITIDAMVHSGDVALVPYGYHGPAAAAPGYDLYYLNVMAGPDPDRQWLISDDPAHSWLREQWNDQELDTRLPFGPKRGETR